MPFRFRNLDPGGVVLVEPRTFIDNRGSFLETYRQADFKEAGLGMAIAQENVSVSNKGVLRGLHYQTDPFSQAKLVRVVRGRIYDVAVDMRRGSNSFSKWVGVELSAEDRHMLYVPRGFAHGFASLADETEVSYLVDNDYSKANEHGVIWNDSVIGVSWPISDPILSEKDTKWPTLDAAETFP